MYYYTKTDTRNCW